MSVAVQRHLADLHHRHQLLGDELGGVEQVEAELVLVLFLDDLQAELPFRIVARLDSLVEVAPVEVGVLARDQRGFLPHQRAHALQRLPVEFDEARYALSIHQPEGVHAKAFHHGEAPRNGAVTHDPHQHVGAFRRQGCEVPESIVRRLGLRDLVMGLGLHRVDQVGELVGVLDEEYRHVVSDEVPYPVGGIELHREAAHVARRVGRAARARHRGEAHEHRRLHGRVLQRRGHRDRGLALIDLEEAVRGTSARMDDALGNTLVVEVRDLLAHQDVFEQSRTANLGF